MLNMISSCESAENAAAAVFAAAKPRPRYGLGASALLDVSPSATARVAASTRPCIDAAVSAAHVVLAESGLGVEKQPVSKQQPEFMTRISASGGGAVGPHTAREPV